MNFAIRYLTEYSYDFEVVDNLNALRVKPAAKGRQQRSSSSAASPTENEPTTEEA